MTKLAGILTILLCLNGIFASDEKIFTAETTTENVKLFLNAVNTETTPKSSLSVQDIKQNENKFADVTLTKTLNSTNKELLEVVRQNAENSTEYIDKVTPLKASPYSVAQDLNLNKSESFNMVLNNVTNLNTNQEEHLLKAAAKPFLSSEERQNLNMKASGSTQINLKNSANTAENATESLTAETSTALSVNTTKDLTSWGELQNSSLLETELVVEKLPHLLNRHQENRDAFQTLTSVTNIEYISKDLKNSSNIPENKEDEKEKKSLSNSNATDGVVLQIVLQEKENSAENQKGIEGITKSSTSEHEANTKYLDSLQSTETRNQSDTELVYKEYPFLSGKEASSGDSTHNCTESGISENTKTIAAHEIDAKATNSLNLFQNSNFTATDNNLSGREAEKLSNITNPSSRWNIFQNPNLTQSGLVSNQSEEFTNSTNNSNNILGDKVSTTINEYKIATKPLNGFGPMENLNSTDSVLLRIVLKDVRNLADKTENSSTEAAGASTGAAATSHSLSKPSNSLQQSQTSHLSNSYLGQIVLKDPTNVTDNSVESSLEVDSTTAASAAAAVNDPTKKSIISLEEYAVKQMNYILDHLLLETQEFVANVLQASINSVFPRDNLKRYAEALNHVLSPENDADYSDEVVEQKPDASPDKIYEEIVRKLNFLKSKPSKYLQKNLPQEWLNDFRNRKEETAIWLDKATDRMHQDLNTYISEEEDHIKYQYFNETFDDMSRAPEIHQKLALLADLVKIVKNKKQITFMDLYMQT